VLATVKDPENIPYKAYLTKIHQDFFSLTTEFKALEAPKEKGSKKKDKDKDKDKGKKDRDAKQDAADAVNADLFGDAAEREDNKVNLETMKGTDTILTNLIAHEVVKVGDDYQDKTVQVVQGIGRQLKETNELADNIIVK